MANPEPLQILVNPLRYDQEYTFNVGDLVDLNNNQPDEIIYTMVSGLNKTFMTWNETSKTIRFIELGVENVGKYTVAFKVENLEGKSSEAELVFEIVNEIQNEKLLAQIMTYMEAAQQVLDDPEDSFFATLSTKEDGLEDSKS